MVASTHLVHSRWVCPPPPFACVSCVCDKARDKSFHLISCTEMIRPNRTYSFVSASAFQPKNVDFSKAQTLTDAASILSANERIGEYEFTDDADLNKLCHEVAERVEISLKTLDSGAIVNDAVLVKSNGKKVSIRLYGTDKKTVNPQTIDKAALAKLSFGKCKSDGETVGNAGVDATGKPAIIPTIYLKLA